MGRTFRGLEPNGTPLGALDCDPVLTNRQQIVVSRLRGPARLATVRLRAATSDERARWLAHWLSPDTVRTGEARAGPSSGSGPTGLSFVDGPAVLSELDWSAQVEHVSLSMPWLALSHGLPDLRRMVTVVVRDQSGIVAGLPCWVCERVSLSYDPLASTGLGIAATPGPVVLAGSRTGYTSTMLLRRGLSAAARRAAVAELLAGVRSLADRKAAAEAWMIYAGSATVARCTASPWPSNGRISWS